MFSRFCRNCSLRMPVSLSEWRIRIGVYVPRVPFIQYHSLVRYLTMKLFFALLTILAYGESKADPPEKEMRPTTTDHQSSSEKPSSNPEKDGTPSGVNSDEQKTPTATADQTKDGVFKGSKKRKHHKKKGRCGPDQSCGAFLSFGCFLKSGACPLLRFLLLVFTTILLLRSGDVELNPGPNESIPSGISDLTLIDIADAVSNDMKIRRLGFHLRAPKAFIDRCFASGRMSGSVTPEGTHQMLSEWRERTERQYQETELRKALIQSHLQDVAERYLPGGSLEHERSTDKQEVDGSTSMATGSSTPHQTKTSHPDIKPITREQLLKCREEIQSSYRVNLCQIPTSPLDSDSIVELQSIFTNLYLLKEDRNTKKKIPLKYEDLLTVDINGEPAKRIMIQGEAGVGKTTFCAKIAWDWVTGERYKDYTLVAVVPLREAKNGRTVGQVLKTYLSDDNDVTSEQLDDYIRTNQDKVLLVFDGFDEFDVEMESGGNQIVQILKGEKHISGRVIVTTRPWKADRVANAVSLKKQYAFVKIEGFKQKEVKTYVTKFYQDDKTSAQTLLEFMEEGSLVTEAMAPFPIFCSMLCHMWKEVERRDVIRKLQTFSQLFQEMIVQLEEHYISKHATTGTFDSTPQAQDIKDKIDDHLKRISEIAFNGLLSNKLSFLEQEFESCADDLLVAYGVGILTREKTMCKREHGAVRKVARVDFTCSFPHKLFQEYTAAKYLQDLFNSNPDEFHEIMQQTILPKAAEFKYLLYFSGSFNDKLAKDVLTRLIDRKVHRGRYMDISRRRERVQSRVQMDLIVEVAFEGHSEEAASVIEEKCQDMHRSITIEKDTSLHAIASYMFVLKQLESLCIKRMPHTKILSRNLAEKVCSLKTLKELQLEGCNITVSFSEILLQHSKEILVETFILQAVKLSKSSSINIAKCICFLPHLKNFKLSTKSSMGDFLLTLLSQASQSKITSLALKMCIFKSESTNLVAIICALPCLQDLKLVCENFSDQFFCALRQQATSLKIKQMHLKGVLLETSDSLAAFALMQNLVSLTLYDVRISHNSKHTEEEGRDPSDTLSSTLLTELNVDHDSFISLCDIGLLKRFPHIQKMTLAFRDGQIPFPQDLLHHVTMPAVIDLTLHGYWDVHHGHASLTSLSLVPFPNTINLSLIYIKIGNDHCKTILESVRNEKTLKTISIKDCDTDADLDPLCNEINAERKMTVTVQHGISLPYSLDHILGEIKNGAE